MAREDREELVATVQETYALMGRTLQTQVPNAVLERALRPEVMEQLATAAVDPFVTDEEMLGLLREAYFQLVEAVLRIQDELLGEHGESYDPELRDRGLTGPGRNVKVRGFRRAIGRIVQGARGNRVVRIAFKWANIILGSLSSIPPVGIAADALQELKDSVETQGAEDQGRG